MRYKTQIALPDPLHRSTVRDSARSAGRVSPRSHPNGCAPASRIAPHTTKSTISLSGCADALSCRRSHFRSSFATRTKRPAISEGAGEHSVHVSQGCASDPHKKWGSRLGSQPAPTTHGGTQASTASTQVVGRRRVRTSSTWQTLRTASCQQLLVRVLEPHAQRSPSSG